MYVSKKAPYQMEIQSEWKISKQGNKYICTSSKNSDLVVF